LLILGFSIFGLYPVFKLLQYQARLEMTIRIRSGVPAAELYDLVFAENESPEWVKENKEFTYQGHFYDVVEVETFGNKTVYRCLKDTKETKINKHLIKLASFGLKQDYQSKEKINSRINFFKFQYISLNLNKEIRKGNILKHNFYYQKRLSSIATPPPVPPPQVS
jgi:hypothetical protein